MNKKAAREALEEGKRITHRFFSEGEFLEKKDGELITTEDGVTAGEEYWKDRTGYKWEEHWEICDDQGRVADNKQTYRPNKKAELEYPMYVKSNPFEFLKIVDENTIVSVKFREKQFGINKDEHVNKAVTSDLAHGSVHIAEEEFKTKLSLVGNFILKTIADHQ